MDINFIAVFVVVIIQMAIGAVWYGPMLFGKIWSDCIGVKMKSPAEMKAMQKAAAPLYAIQFVLSLITNVVVAFAVSRGVASGVCTALTLWLGFVAPTQAGGVLWDNLSNKVKVQKFLVSTGYQLIGMVIAGLVFERWI